MKHRSKDLTDTLRAEYNLTELLKTGVVGKHVKQYREGTNVVLIEPEIYREFKTPQAVNDALRSVIESRKKKTNA